MLYYSTKIIALLCRKTKTDAGILLETTKQEVNKNNEVMDSIQEVRGKITLVVHWCQVETQ